MNRFAFAAVVLVSGLSVPCRASGDEPLVPYDGLQAGADAHAQAEVARRQRLDDQLYLNDAMRTRYGWRPEGSVVWYGAAGGYRGYSVGIDYAYAYSSERLPGRYGRRLYFDRYWSPALSVFEPWPYVPGDIYGYAFPPRIRQPIGQRQIQTGPNRWESHPVYAEDIAPPVSVETETVEPAESEPEVEPAPRKLRRRSF